MDNKELKVDFSRYDYGEKEAIEEVEEIPNEYKEKAKEVGIEVDKGEGIYFQIDHNVIYQKLIERLRRKGVIIMSVGEALRRFAWAKMYYWRALSSRSDKVSKIAEEYRRNGYFIYVPPRLKLDEPIQACLFIAKQNIAQPVHNLIIVGDGAEVTLITGCTAITEEALHIGVSEFYISNNAKLTFIMIHNWTPKIHVRPRTGVIVGKGGIFINYYVNMRPGITLQMLPKAILYDGAKAYLTSIIKSGGEALVDIGGRIIFKGNDTRGEVITRSVAMDRSEVTMRGILKTEGNVNARGHLECRGLLLSDSAKAIAIPQLEARGMRANLTHEAAIGKISEKELNYLMAKGFTEEEAVSIIVRGFLEAGVELLPENVREGVRLALDSMAKSL